MRLSKCTRKREDFANYFHIPLGTVRDWEQGKRKMPEYVYELIEYKASRPPKYYNLDVIISVGYRVKSKRGVEFRKWANSILKKF